ncbi:MAG: glutamine amidotransferase [Chitinispirillia bacterium]|nr:glutamine amidotransferase [Chitinispirillia bacterium]MCL2268178.1 glutamine amidotransferase [Chitinispirillia bacterium]
MNVFVYIINTLADWEIAYITAEINSGRYLKKSIEKPEIVKVGKNSDSIKTMGGIEITPDITVKEIQAQKGDLLILPGADTWQTENHDEILNFLKNNIGKNITIAAICGATIALAYNGLLNEVKHTSENLDLLKMMCPNYTGEKNYCNVPAVTDNNLITASGLAPLEFTYEILKKINVMEKNTVDAWYNFFKTRDGKYYFELMNSIK